MMQAECRNDSGITANDCTIAFNAEPSYVTVSISTSSFNALALISHMLLLMTDRKSLPHVVVR